WLSASVPDPAKATDEKRYHAIRQWVRGGGHLVICQPPQREATVNFDDIMPVKVTAVSPKADLDPLKRLATEKLIKQREQEKRETGATIGLTEEEIKDQERGPGLTQWERNRGPYMFARGDL